MLPSRFTDVEHLGAGGFAQVFKVTDAALGRVAVKTLTTQRQDVRDRFLREISIQSKISHPNIVQIDDYDVNSPEPWYVMDIAHSDFHEYISDKNNTDETIIELFHDALSGVGHAHGQHILHRDLKPQNILVYEHINIFSAKVADFGLGRHLTREHMDFETKTEYIAGTFDYMAPEQRGNFKEVTQTADVYSAAKILEFILRERPSIDRDFPQYRNCVRIGTKHNSDDRYQSIEQFALALRFAFDNQLQRLDPVEYLKGACAALTGSPEDTIYIDRVMDALEKNQVSQTPLSICAVHLNESAVVTLCNSHYGRLKSWLIEVYSNQDTPESVQSAISIIHFYEDILRYTTDDELQIVVIFGIMNLASIYQMSEFVEPAEYHAYSNSRLKNSSIFLNLVDQNEQVKKWILADLDPDKLCFDASQIGKI